MKTTYRTITEKVAVITGGAKGIGARIAHRFSSEGYAVAVAYRNSEAEADKLVAELSAHGRAIAVKADLSTASGANALRSAVISQFGRVDVLVNNAGSAFYGVLGSMTEEEIERTLGDNLKSAILTSRAFYDDFAFGKKGAIVNVSSVWGIKGASAEAVYSAAKFGVAGLTKSLAKELAPSGVRVNAVAPGIIMTDMLSRFGADELDDMLREIPCGRFGRADDVAEVVFFLASDKAAYITGEIIDVSGGYVI